MLVFNVIEDTGFYWVHRWLHTPWAYAKIHKVHHEYTGKHETRISILKETSFNTISLSANQLDGRNRSPCRILLQLLGSLDGGTLLDCVDERAPRCNLLGMDLLPRDALN